VRGLHRLDAANARLRHSVVEACFYNLRMLAQELPGRRGDREFARHLAEALQNVAAARKLIEEHFAYEVVRGVTIADLFSDQSEKIERSLREIEAWAARGAPSRQNRPACRDFADCVVRNVDELLAAIDEVKREIGRLRIPAAELLQALASIHRPVCEAQGVALSVEDGSDAKLEVFADRESLLSALGELIRNALRHGFEGASGRDHRITLRLCADPDTRDTIISVSDNGRGMTPERLEMVGAAGASTSGGGDGVATVRRIVEGEHLGLVTFESRPGEGTSVHVRLPRRAEPALEPEPASPQPASASSYPQESAALEGRISLKRKLAALLVLVGMTAIGLLLAWLVARQ